MVDYYALLGLDFGASPESIKVAYRRLAREFHPDRQVNSSEQERIVTSARMAELNEAYSILSDPKRKREYDDNQRVLGILKNSSSEPASKTTSGKPAAGTASAKPHPGAGFRQEREGDSTIVKGFSKQLRANLLAKRKGLDWHEKKLEGFDWGLEATTWSSHYCLAARGFALLDPAAAKKFANYSEIVIAQCKRSVRKSHFLFLVPFQQLSEWETVSTLLQRVIAGDKHPRIANVPIGIALVDLRQGRTLRLGGLPKEEPFNQILQTIGATAA